MREKTLWISLVIFFAGLCLITLSYARFIDISSVWCSILRELGVALTIAAIIGASVDTIFQKHLVSTIADKAEKAAEKLTNGIDDLSKTVYNISSESKEVLARVPIISCCLHAGISNIYLSRSDKDAEERIIESLRNAKTRVDIMGISLRTFFQGGGKVNNAVNQIMKHDNQKVYKAEWRVLIIDRDSEQAKLRSEREEPAGQDYEYGNLYREVKDTIEIVGGRFIKEKAKIELKVYRGAPACFLLRVDDVMFVEQYHYGRERGQRAAELVPLIEFQKKSTMFPELEGHFEYVWESLSRDPYHSENETSSNAEPCRD